MSIDGWMDKEIDKWNISHKREWNLAICDNMDVPWGYYAKWNKSDRERQIPYNLIYMWDLKNKTNKQTKQNKTHRHRKQNGGCQGDGGVGGWEKWVKGVKRYKLTVIK